LLCATEVNFLFDWCPYKPLRAEKSKLFANLCCGSSFANGRQAAAVAKLPSDGLGVVATACENSVTGPQLAQLTSLHKECTTAFDTALRPQPSPSPTAWPTALGTVRTEAASLLSLNLAPLVLFCNVR
jgi:hypothetical protein